MRTALVVALLLAAGGTAGCRADEAPERGPLRPPSTFDEATPRMREKIQALVDRVPSATPEERMDIGREISAHGGAATPALLEMLRHPDPQVRSLGAWVLGYRDDPRVLPALEEATRDPVSFVALEAAAAMLRLGESRGVLRLVDGLEDPDPALRARSIFLLRRTMGTTLEYEADDDPEERAAAVARWRDLLARRGTAGPP